MLHIVCLLALIAGAGDAVPVRTGAGVTSSATVRARTYTMSGAVRPLFFWISRDNVGLARITWRRGDAGERGYEFLVGTDPARAPRGINRWGYIAEEADAADGSVLALMMGSPDTSYDDEASGGAAEGGTQLRAMRSGMRRGVATWQTARIQSGSALTIHDLHAALEHVDRQMTTAPWRQASSPWTRASAVRDGAPVPRPGFLIAVAEAIDRALAARSTERNARRPGPVSYVFGRETYQLDLRDADPVTVTRAGQPVPALRLVFESRPLSNASRTRFEITCATTGDLAGVPLVIEWQPRWWLRATLRLDG